MITHIQTFEKQNLYLNCQETLELQYFQKIQVLTQHIKHLKTEIGYLQSELAEAKDANHAEALKEIEKEECVQQLNELVKKLLNSNQALTKQLSEATRKISKLENIARNNFNELWNYLRNNFNEFLNSI